MVEASWLATLRRRPEKDQNVFNSIGPTELIIVLVIVLVIFGPKRLPGLGRSLGSGMKEFRDSISGKGSRQGLRRRRRRRRDDADTRSQANAALGRPDEDTAPVDGEVVSERTRTLALARAATGHGHGTAADRARRSSQPRRAPRRAAHADHHLPRRLPRGVRRLLLAERPDPGDHGPAAREVGVHEGQRGSARAHRARSSSRSSSSSLQLAVAQPRRWRGPTTSARRCKAQWAELSRQAARDRRGRARRRRRADR